MKILQIANYVDGVGGISVQVKLIRDHLMAEGYSCGIFSTKGSIVKRLLSPILLFIKGREYDVFHIHASSNRGFFPAIIGVSVGVLLRKRTVLTYHGGGVAEFLQRRAKLVRFFLTKTNVNIVLSGFVGSVYDKYYIPYVIIPNIVELQNDVYKRRKEIKPRIISIRSLTDTYNVICTLRAFQKVLNHYPDAHLLIVGDGPQRKELEEFVKENAIQNVVFVGRVNNSEIYDFLNQSDIMVSSSRFDNMPVSVLEGFNAGLLVVVSKVGGVPYMVRDGENGLLFSSDNDEEMAAKIIWALGHQDQTLQMIEVGHQDVNHYSWNSIKESLFQAYGKDN